MHPAEPSSIREAEAQRLLQQQQSSTSSSSELRVPRSSSSGSVASAGTVPLPEKAELLATASSTGKGDIALCRICLEEDNASDLEIPCGCAGTQRWAHHSCIQRWVEEKGHLKCEICGQQYKGNFTVPPPPPPPEPQQPQIVTSMFIVDPENPTRLIPAHSRQAQLAANSRAAAQAALLDDSDVYQRHPAMNCVFTACVFIFFLVVLHHSTIADDQMDGQGPGYHYMPSPPPPYSYDDGSDSLADNLLILVLWIVTKALLIALPLWAIMRVAHRQAERQQYEAMREQYERNRHVIIRVHRPHA